MFYIISAELNTLDSEYNNIRTSQLKDRLEKAVVPYYETVGVYKGVRERSFRIKDCPNFSLNDAIGLGREFNQESILILDKADKAHLLYLNNMRLEGLGKVKFSLSEPTDKDSYTDLGIGYIYTE